MDVPGEFSSAGLADAFASMPGDVWRSKGFLIVDGEPSMLQFTMGQLEIERAPARERFYLVMSRKGPRSPPRRERGALGAPGRHGMTVAELVAARRSAPRSLAERAYEHLVREITRLELAPGEVLADKALIDRFEIGRTPLREALQRLAREGLVVHCRTVACSSPRITADSVQQIYEFRALIDGHAARLAATRASESEMDSLRVLHVALVGATEGEDIDTFVTMDRIFYDVLAQAARNVYLAEVIPRIFNLHLRLWFFISNRIGGWHSIARSHEEMTRGVSDASDGATPTKQRSR